MKKKLLLLFFCFTVIAFHASHAQVCPTDLLTGQNLVVNGDFSQGYTGWSYTEDPTGTNGYIKFGSTGQTYSGPGYIYAGASADFFNRDGFNDYPDNSPSNDNMMLMVDGICKSGITLWSQNITVAPNTNYYFSLWISSLKDNPNYPGNLDFRVGPVGGTLTSLGTPVTAPAAGHVWQFYEATWNSGSNSGLITITIANTTTQGCDTEVDFAIDDISFIPGCSYGSAGPQPDLGPDKTLCGLGAGGLLLDSGVPHNPTTTVTWSDGTTGFGMNAPYTKHVTAAGTYSVCVSDNGSCTKSDIIVISDVFSIDLGPDRELCDPASVTLDANFSGSGVTYRWFKNGIAAEGNNTRRTYFVNTPGTYKVEVRDPICGLQTDEITITTKAPQVTNQVYCDPGNITLNVTPNNNGKYNWWSSPTGTADADIVQKGGDSYTFAATPTADYTFYVQDTAAFRVPVGLSSAAGLTGRTGRGSQNETVITFDILTAITIDSIYLDMNVYSCGTPVGIEVRNSSGTLIGNATWIMPSTTNGCLTGDRIVKMPVGIAVPVGTGYTIKYLEPTVNNIGNNTDLYWYEDGMTYPQTFSGIVKFVGPKSPEISGWKPNSIPGMYRWVVTAGTACARVPVQAIYKSCVPPTPPVADAGTDIKICNTHTTQLKAAALSTDETGVWTFAAGSTGTITPATSPTATMTFTGDTTYVVWTVTNTSSGLSDKDTVMVTTTIVDAPAINAVSQTCAGTTGLTFTVSPDNTTTGSIYQWSVISGDISFVSGAATTQLTADAGVMQSVVRITETKNGCSASSTHVLNMSPPTDQAVAGPDQKICTTSTLLTGNIPVNGTGSWTALTNDPSQIITQVPPNAATVSGLSDNTIYEYIYQITGPCGITDTIVKVSVGTGGFTVSSITQPLDTACVGSERNLTAHVSGGSGSYTYVWMKKGTFHWDEKPVPTYTLTTSSVSETYYLYVKDNSNAGCVTNLDSVKIASIDFQKLAVPNLITPNGDGLNDVLKIAEVGNWDKPMLAKGSILTIYNRWGTEIFRANNYNNDWKAANTSDGMYYYYLKAGCGGEEHKSWIQILGNTNK
jgi:hypothetical protein